MIVPEHLDWHPDFEDYLEAKANLFAHQSPEDIAIYFDDNEYSRQLAYRSAGVKIPYYQTPGARVREDGKIVIGEPETEVIHKDEIKLLGEHNLQNVCAATTAIWYSLTDAEDQAKLQAVAKTLTTFTGLEHRLELVRETHGTKYYNDSFAATPDATLAAIKSIPSRKVLIMGGFDRQLPLEGISKEIASHEADLRKIILIGQSAQRVADNLKKVGFINYEITNARTMPEIVGLAKGFAQEGDVVILSPGFPSFDMFKNFADRGQQFKEAVNDL
jgi:UDP-N-acetylmuramoylalanine--D-glutamate ligase